MIEVREFNGYPDYTVFSNGRIKSFKKDKNGIFLKGYKNKKGYVKVTLTNEHGLKHFPVHRVIAKTFIPNPNNLPQVNHKNGVKTDNMVSNLEWCTHDQNQKHAALNGLYLRGENSVKGKLKEKQVI